MPSLLSERVLVLLTLLIAAGALFATTFGTDYRLLGAVQSPVYFPRIILGIMIALTLAAIFQDVAGRKAVEPVEKWGALIVFVIAALIYANVITRVGFMLASMPFCVLALLVFGIRSPLAIAAYAILVPGSLVVLFNHVLKLPLPTSPFTYLF
ncbi:tripartite tricarboxylate transporter TctB family protein [Roseibacterium sp. SDUM158017]|uniref:tripartite tricarboxylate transporter TctB family protein n=1 Tax=Roseicyclus salinarum TaxID=3036773 RepID=UPI00241551A4|nr:tripartite tricarboxylate transporter TctB family protein [Roseibacterium sp. SDUM158017]MDG4649750.1 tripartite tricarboxylate transporter TctB family protein [Roseibacterium sp. SDUM158017]